MSGFDPGPGWREVTDSEYRHSLGQPRLLSTDGSQGQGTRYWVREAPVPPLPTTPYTVIEVDAEGDADGPWYLGGELWWRIGSELELTPEDLHKRIVRWAPRAEPRAATAKAVLDRLREMAGSLFPVEIDDVAREFGVDHA